MKHIVIEKRRVRNTRYRGLASQMLTTGKTPRSLGTRKLDNRYRAPPHTQPRPDSPVRDIPSSSHGCLCLNFVSTFLQKRKSLSKDVFNVAAFLFTTYRPIPIPTVSLSLSIQSTGPLRPQKDHHQRFTIYDVPDPEQNSARMKWAGAIMCAFLRSVWMTSRPLLAYKTILVNK
jgi:hypothetical protein